MQNSDNVTSKTDKLFLLPNAAARLKRSKGGFDLTSAGLMSLIAACGGSDGGSTAPIPDPTVLDDIVELAPAIVSSADLDKIKPPFADRGTVSADGNVTMDNKTISIAVSGPSKRKKFILKEDSAMGTASDFTVTAVTKNDSSYRTTSLEMGYGNLDGDSRSELIFASLVSGKGTLAVIWNYDPAVGTGKHGGKTFNLIGNDTASVGDDYEPGQTPDNASINHLRIEQENPVYGGFAAKDAYGVWANAVDLGDESGDESTALFVGATGSLEKNNITFPTSAVFVVWDIADYAGKTDTVTLEATSVANESFIISSEGGHKITHSLTQALDLGNDGKMDLILSRVSSVHIIWDIAFYKGSSSAFSLESNDNADKFFSIQATNSAFAESEFSSVDLDGDGYNDLYSDYKGGIIIWGSEFAAKPTGTIMLDDGADATMFDADSSTADKVNGTWIGGIPPVENVSAGTDAPLLKELRDSLWFADVNGDGLRDAISKTANTENKYDWWALTGKQNAATVSRDTSGPVDIISVKFGDPEGTSQTQSELNALGIYPDYYRQDLNKDGKLDFIAKTANPALDDGKVYHNVWYAKGNGSLDSTARHDALVQVAAGAAAGNLADGADTFQLVDIA